MGLANMRIGMRMAIGFSAVLLLAVIIALSGIWSVKSVAGMTEKLLQSDAKILEHGQRARANVNALRRYEKDFFINMGNKEKESAYMKEWRGTHDRLLDRLNDLGKYATFEKDKELVKEMKGLAAVYDTAFNKVVEAIHAGKIKTTQEANDAMGESKASIHKMEALVADFAGEGVKRMAATEEVQKASSSHTTLVLIILALCAVILGLGISFIITRSIVGPLNKVIGGLTDGSDQVSAAANQVSSSSQQLAEGTSEQASSLEETSSSLEEMSSMTKQNADHANEAKVMMGEAKKIVEKVNHHMTDMASAVGEITNSSEETGKIIKTIDEIAFQTNLLALNAAVEAARAGEAGAGFAVVADEVRNLAMRAAEAAKTTSNLIENTIKAVNNGKALTDATQEAFRENTAISMKIDQLVAEIAMASDEQAQGIKQVNIAVSEMDKVTQSAAANAEESAAAAEELNAQAEQMKGYVEALVKMVGGANGNGNGHRALSAGSGSGPRRLPSMQNQKPLLSLSHSAAGTHLAVKGHRAARIARPDQIIPMEDGDFKDF